MAQVISTDFNITWHKTSLKWNILWSRWRYYEKNGKEGKKKGEHFKNYVSQSQSQVVGITEVWAVEMYFISDDQSTPWWTMLIFHNFFQNITGCKIYKWLLEVDSLVCLLLLLFVLEELWRGGGISKHVLKVHLLPLKNCSNPKVNFIVNMRILLPETNKNCRNLTILD